MFYGFELYLESKISLEYYNYSTFIVIIHWLVFLSYLHSAFKKLTNNCVKSSSKNMINAESILQSISPKYILG